MLSVIVIVCGWQVLKVVDDSRNTLIGYIADFVIVQSQHAGYIMQLSLQQMPAGGISL